MTRQIDNHHVTLRPVAHGDLAIMFEQQTDPDANYMAAFTVENPNDWAYFEARWHNFMADNTNNTQVIIVNDQVVGHVARFQFFGEPTIGYWLGKPFWGQGIATEAVQQFLTQVEERPLYARVAQDNIASIRVLEKCGFKRCGEDKGYSNARGTEVGEYIYKLDAL